MAMNPFGGWVVWWIAAQRMIGTNVGVAVKGLVYADTVNVHDGLVRSNHFAKSRVEAAGTLWVVAVIAIGAPFRAVIGEAPRRRDGCVENEIAWFDRNL